MRGWDEGCIGPGVNDPDQVSTASRADQPDGGDGPVDQLQPPT